MNNYQISLIRDKKVIELLLTVKAATTNQIKALYFPGKGGYRKCCYRLEYLRNHELIQWIERPFIDMPSVYYLKEKPALSSLHHIIAVTWIYVWLSKRFEVEYWEQEVDFGILQCDAICRIKGGQWYFIELDRVASHNKFKKPMQYTELFQKERYEGSELRQRLDNPKNFPSILIITDSTRRGVNIKKTIKENNSSGLYYGLSREVKDEIYLFDAIVKEVQQWK